MSRLKKLQMLRAKVGQKDVVSTKLEQFAGVPRATPLRKFNPDCKHKDGFDAVPDPQDQDMSIVYCISCDYEIRVKKSTPI